MGIVAGPRDAFYSESPGMIIDRLAIIFLRCSVIQDLLVIITEADLLAEYKKKESIISKQIEDLGDFLDLYFKRLVDKEVFFAVQQAVKIYNDTRVKKYIAVVRL